MAPKTSTIFDDLEIDYSTMMTDPESFDQNVKKAADELKATLKSSTSIQSFLDSQKNTDDMSSWKVNLNALYNDIESEMSIAGILEMAREVRKFASELESLARSKAAFELANKQGVMDKGTAHMMYVRLREAFNAWANAMKVLDIYEATPLPSMPGNYGTNVGLVFHYYFTFDGEEEGYMNPRTVCRLLGIDSMNLMDTVEYVTNNPDCGVTVTKLTK
jgi:hypothetical protein